MLTQALVNSLFLYDPNTGCVTHKINKGKVKAGSRAGSVSKTGARYLRVQGKKELEHRIIWLMVYGHLPPKEVDHINHERGDNRIDNLRCVGHPENMQNKSAYRNNSVGHTGVSIDKQCGKFRAYVSVQGKPKGLGYFTSLEDACAARASALAQLEHYHANHGN